MDTSPLSRFDRAKRDRPRASARACARAAAADVIAELGLSEPPINLDMVTSYLGIHAVTRVHGLEEAGCLICGAGFNQILVRAGTSAGRERFTIAHECSHTFFPGYSLTPQYRCAPLGRALENRELERRCDQAASELLMPARLLQTTVDGRAVSFGLIEEVADTFRTSLTAAAIRTVDVATTPTAFLTFEVRSAGAGTRRMLRLASFCSSGSGWPFFKINAAVDDDSPIARAVEGEVVHEFTELAEFCHKPVRAEVLAEFRPYFDGASGRRRPRVLAILRAHG